MIDKLEFHPSALTAAADCELRSVIGMFPKLFTDRGYEFRRMLPGAGAAVGTAVHTSLAHLTGAKMREEYPDLGEATEIAIQAFKNEIVDGFETDATTPSINAAEGQIIDMSRISWLMWGISQDVLLSEQSFTTDLTSAIGPRYSLEMRIDQYHKNDSLVDIKTGSRQSVYPLQLGAYSLGLRSHGYQPKWIGHLFVKRVKKRENNERPQLLQYDREVSERLALAQMQRVAGDVEKFEKTGNIEVFSMNVSSNLCSPKYCKAYLTNVCPMWPLKESMSKGAKDD